MADMGANVTHAAEGLDRRSYSGAGMLHMQNALRLSNVVRLGSI
jgi:hypothetical protein